MIKNVINNIKENIGERCYGRLKPAFIVVGVQKGGTTALYKYLSLHPQLTTPPIAKEINFFNCEREYKQGGEAYHRKFPLAKSNRLRSFDISPAYMLDAEEVSMRIAAYDPLMKIIAILREPVSRAFSAWNMYKKYWDDDREWFLRANWVVGGGEKNRNLLRRSKQFGEDFIFDLEEEIEAMSKGRRIEMPIVEYGFYKEQLQQFYDILDNKNILILASDELKRETYKTLYNIEDFLGLEHYNWLESDLVPHFVGDYDAEIPAAAAKLLSNIYKERNAGLDRLIAQNLAWPSLSR